METNREYGLSPAPEGYEGLHISVDEMEPEFNSQDSTVVLHPEAMKYLASAKVGGIILVGSNENPKLEGFGQILEMAEGYLKVKMLD